MDGWIESNKIFLILMSSASKHIKLVEEKGEKSGWDKKEAKEKRKWML